MAPPVKPNEVIFYFGDWFNGESYTYRVGDDVRLPRELANKFRSVNVGKDAKVIAWQYDDATGIYKEWSYPHTSINHNVKDLTRLRVTDPNVCAISFRLEDATGEAPGRYVLRVDSDDVGSVLVYSRPVDSVEEYEDEYRLVGFKRKGWLRIRTFGVHDERTGNLVCSGTAYFSWDEYARHVQLLKDGDWPKRLRAERMGEGAFRISLLHR